MKALQSSAVHHRYWWEGAWGKEPGAGIGGTAAAEAGKSETAAAAGAAAAAAEDVEAPVAVFAEVHSVIRLRG